MDFNKVDYKELLEDSFKLYNNPDNKSTTLQDIGVQFDCNDTTKNSPKDIKNRFVEPSVVPQVFVNEYEENIDNTWDSLENAKFAHINSIITRDNFYDSTACDWKEVKSHPEGKPDYESDSGSKYWYTDSGVYRESDHWGFGVGSCDWTLNENPELSWRDNEKVRVGYADFKDFKNTEGKSFPQIFEMLTPKEAGLEDTDQNGDIYYFNYRTNDLENKNNFVDDKLYPASIETRLYTECASEGADTPQPSSVTNNVNENVVDNVSNSVVNQVGGQSGTPRNYGSKKPGSTSLKNYASNQSIITKRADAVPTRFYHGSQRDNLKLKNGPLYLTSRYEDAVDFAEGYLFDYDLQKEDTPVVYTIDVSVSNPKVISTEEEYDELMDISVILNSIPGLKQGGYDSIYYPEVGDIVVFDASSQCIIIEKEVINREASFELTTIEKIAEEIVVEADLESKKPYLLKDLEKSKFDEKDYDQIIDICNDMDPTGKKAVYTQWILRHHVLNEEPISGYDSIDYLQKFTDLKNSKKLQNADADINQYKSFADLKEKVDQVLEETGGYTSKRNEEKTKAEEGIKKLDQDGDLELYLVNTPEAAAHEFRDTEWCVKDPKFFEQYAETDKNFYYFKKGGQPYLLVHRQDYKDVDDNRPSEEILDDIRKLLIRNKLCSINANIASYYLKNGFIQKSSNPEEYHEMVDSIIKDGFGPHLLYDRIITKDYDPETFKRLIDQELYGSRGVGCMKLLRRGIVTPEDTEYFTKAVNGVIDNISESTGKLYNYIKDIPELYEKAVTEDIERGHTDYLIEGQYLTREKNPDLYDKCIREAIPGRVYVGLNWIDKGFITKDDTPELFDIAITQALKDHNDEYILEKGWLTQEEIDSYKQQPSEETEQTPLDDTTKESAFEFTNINKLADLYGDSDRGDEIPESQNKFLNSLPVSEVDKDQKQKLMDEAKKVNKVINYIPKSLNYPFIEDEMAGNVLFFSETDFMEDLFNN